jgi:prefoldin beta subunit
MKESELVLQELKLVKDTTSVYKMVGTILMKQEPAEAIENVAKRLDFIKSELFIYLL